MISTKWFDTVGPFNPCSKTILPPSRCVNRPQTKLCEDGATPSEISCDLRLLCTQNICAAMFCHSVSLPLLPKSDSALFPFMGRLPQKGPLKWKCKIKTSSWVPFLTVDLHSHGGSGGVRFCLSLSQQLQRDLTDVLSLSGLGVRGN